MAKFKGVIRKKSSKYDPNLPRKFFVSPKPPLDIYQEGFQQNFPNNRIETSKYNLINFLPKNLFEQFRRIANFYFLCVCIIHFSINSPVSPITSLLPLLLVVTVTGVKQGYEDWKRHKVDNCINNAPAQVLIGGEFKEIPCFRIAVGDIVKVCSDEEFPCDLLFLTSSNFDTTCEVTTANLDGETNLKSFHSPLTDSENFLVDNFDFSAIIECQHPHANLYDFKGCIYVLETGLRKVSCSLNTNHLLLRGSRLKNTDFIYGCAVYTGKETKMALNSKITANKFSTAEISCNYYLVIFLVVLILEVFTTTTLKYEVFRTERLEDLWYLGPINTSRHLKSIAQDSFSFFILYSYIIPISLYVMLEMQKFLGSFFFQWDNEMRSDKTGEFAICNTSDLNEELGQVQYIFTDKTGTLTENSMCFKQCSVNGIKLRSFEGKLQSIDKESTESITSNTPKSVEDFLVTLALCHTVKATMGFIPGENPCFTTDIPLQEQKLHYMASSPDEKALIEACCSLGIVFQGEKDKKILLSLQGKEKSFERLQTLDFDHDRKLMSVIVRDLSDGQIWLLSKGAEVSIFTRCPSRTTEDATLHRMTMKHINDFARLGYRTLAVAKKNMTEKEYASLAEKLEKAKQEIKNRDDSVRSVIDEIECGLTLLGATGVEDLLQDGVQETLESFAVANIKIWVLTGDKMETAVNVAYLCGLFKQFTTILYLTNLNNPDEVELKLEENKEEIKNATSKIGLVVDGTSLLLLMEGFLEPFYHICRDSSAVVCCRMSPKQKAEIIKFVKRSHSPERIVCAAVGDGANDVSMIQEADIGIGIMGKEGRQAVRCSDFAVARFRFLQRAFLVHGHWYYTRIATLILYNFYKNVVFVSPQVFFSFQSAFSSQSVYDGLVLTLINVIFTPLPIIFYGLFEQVYPADQLMKRPYLYKKIKNNRNMSRTNIIRWTLLGLWHSVVLYYGLWAATQKMAYIPDGKTQDIYTFGIMLAFNVVIVCNLKLIVESKYQTTLFLASIVLSIVIFYIVYLIFCGTLPVMTFYWTFYELQQTPLFYCATLVLVTICLLPDIFINILQTLKF